MNEQDCVDKYLEVARSNEDVMIAAIREFHPYYSNHRHNGNITAKAEEEACVIVRKQIKKEVTEDPVVGYRQYEADKIMRIAGEVWFGMPESSSIRNHTSFWVCCELAEGY